MSARISIVLALGLIACGAREAQPDAGGDASTESSSPDVAIIDDAPADAPAVLPFTFTLTASLHVARNAHTATLLPSGKVLVVGGEDSARVPLTSIELFDPVAKTWTEIGQLPEGRTNHTATLLPNGKVLVTGGGRVNSGGLPTGAGVMASAVVVDPDAKTLVTPVASLAVGRSHHVAALLADGRVLVAGGVPTNNAPLALDDAEIYDPAKDSWKVVTSTMTRARALASAAVVSGRVVIAGGFSSDGSTPSSYEIFDPSTETFASPGAAIPSGGRVFGAIATLAGGSTAVLVGGVRAGGGTGDFVDEADLFAAGAWTSSGSIGGARDAVALVALPDGRAVALGGFTNDPVYTPISNVAVYSNGAWYPAGELQMARSSPTATLLPSGSILVVGGFGAKDVVATSELSAP